MNIIDINTSIGQTSKDLRFSTGEGLMEWLDRYHIQKAITSHHRCIFSPLKGNEEIYAESQKWKGRLKPCFLVDMALGENNLPGTGSFLDRMNKLRPSALKLHWANFPPP